MECVPVKKTFTFIFCFLFRVASSLPAEIWRMLNACFKAHQKSLQTTLQRMINNCLEDLSLTPIMVHAPPRQHLSVVPVVLRRSLRVVFD